MTSQQKSYGRDVDLLIHHLDTLTDIEDEKDETLDNLLSRTVCKYLNIIDKQTYEIESQEYITHQIEPSDVIDMPIDGKYVPCIIGPFRAPEDIISFAKTYMDILSRKFDLLYHFSVVAGCHFSLIISRKTEKTNHIDQDILDHLESEGSLEHYGE